MKIAIFETAHFEGAYPLIRLFDMPGNEITIFTNSYCYRQFRHLFKEDAGRYRWVVKEDTESKYRFMYRLYKGCKDYKVELLYLNTVTDNFIFYAPLVMMLGKLRVILTLHDINTYFSHRFRFSLRRWVRIAGKIWLIRVIREFNVVSLTMVNYLQSKLPAGKKVHCLPGAIFEESRVTHETDSLQEIRIAVPGSIDEKRRNYDEVFELLQLAGHEQLPVSVILLGAPHGSYGEAIINRCRQYRKNQDNLKFYEGEIVDQPEFDRVLDEAHFIFVPSVIQTMISDEIPETYGESKSSGNIFDIIKHAKPFIAPSGLAVDPYLENSCIRYHNLAEVISALLAISRQPEWYEKLRGEALRASRHYTIDSIRKRNPSVFVNHLPE